MGSIAVLLGLIYASEDDEALPGAARAEKISVAGEIAQISIRATFVVMVQPLRVIKRQTIFGRI